MAEAEAEVGQVEVSAVPTTFDQSVVLLDVRENDEWRRGHADRGPAHPDGRSACPARRDRSRREAIRGLPSRWPVDAGGQYLAVNGYAPINVSGGMQAWADAGRPVVTDGGGVGTV
jgi:rhodanese-related sulfurtransferase